MPDFDQTVGATFSFTAPSIELGIPLHEGKLLTDVPVRIPLSMMNRHGLIAGSTGTGKTRTLQLLAESLSRAGVPTFLADVKGDLAGMSAPGTLNPKISERMAGMKREFHPEAFPVEFFSLTGKHGAQLRATVSSFGPVLLGKVLDLSEAQQSVLAMVFKYCDDQHLPLLDFKDLREVLGYLSDEGKEDLRAYGVMSAQTVGVLVRKMVELEQQGAAQFFGEPELDINDLMRTSSDGRGIVNILSLADVQDKPRLFSTFLMWLLGQFYYRLPEVGDPEKPKFVFFFDEAHLLFDDSSSALVEHIEQVARLIRSKGVGVFFITQTPKDISEDVLSQLGNRIQHAVRAFTPRDAKNLKASASTFPKSRFYSVEQTLTVLGTGEALVTVLNPKGIPTEVVVAQILTPSSSMTSIDEAAYARISSASNVASRYGTSIDRESAHEILQRKLAASAADEKPAAPATRKAAVPKAEKGVLEQVFNNKVTQQMARQAARTVTQQVVRGIFGLLKGR